MNFISWNIRDLGGGGKHGVIRKLLREKKVSFLGLVETKCTGIRESSIRKFWGDNEFQWVEVDAINMSGGLLCVWDKNFLSIKSIIQGSKWLCIRGFKQEMACSVALILVYGPYVAKEKGYFGKSCWI